jgi:uncharacterized protein
MLRSHLYECQVSHARFKPKAHAFTYRIFMFALDLDELETLHAKLPFFSLNRRNLYAFHERDFLPTGEQKHNVTPEDPAPQSSKLTPAGLKERVVAYLDTHGIDLTGGRVLLVTLPRILGYLFNPVSFYFCYDRQGTPVAAVAEVTNTFREMKPFLITAASVETGTTTFHARQPKHFYVSPYSDVDVAFDFKLRVPDQNLAVQIDDYTDGVRTFTSSLAGPRRELTGGRLFWFSIKYPLLTLRIIGLIHWHALLLWLKRVPWFAKAARADAQRDLYRPHESISHSNDAV